MTEIARQVFGTLNHDKGHHYIVLVDGYFDHDFYADNDQEAIKEWKQKLPHK